MILDDLIADAIALAGDSAVAHDARLWKSEGGRPCPLGHPDCSQTVFRSLLTDEWDYGYPGGPGHAECAMRCPHQMLPVPGEGE